MNDPLQQLFSTSVKANLFPPGSRYYGVETAIHESADGSRTPYLRRRFIPPPSSHATVAEHVVAGGERLDGLAARYLGDPRAWWRICDANAAMRPEDLTDAVGTIVRITLPAGIPGAPNA